MPYKTTIPAEERYAAALVGAHAAKLVDNKVKALDRSKPNASSRELVNLIETLSVAARDGYIPAFSQISKYLVGYPDLIKSALSNTDVKKSLQESFKRIGRPLEVEKLPQIATELNEKAAELGDTRGALQFAQDLLTGRGRRINPRAAYSILRDVSNDTDLPAGQRGSAYKILADMYTKGTGPAQNTTIARQLYARGITLAPEEASARWFRDNNIALSQSGFDANREYEAPHLFEFQPGDFVFEPRRYPTSDEKTDSATIQQYALPHATSDIRYPGLSEQAAQVIKSAYKTANKEGISGDTVDARRKYDKEYIQKELGKLKPVDPPSLTEDISAALAKDRRLEVNNIVKMYLDSGGDRSAAQIRKIAEELYDNGYTDLRVGSSPKASMYDQSPIHGRHPAKSVKEVLLEDVRRKNAETLRRYQERVAVQKREAAEVAIGDLDAVKSKYADAFISPFTSAGKEEVKKSVPTAREYARAPETVRTTAPYKLYDPVERPKVVPPAPTPPASPKAKPPIPGEEGYAGGGMGSGSASGSQVPPASAPPVAPQQQTPSDAYEAEKNRAIDAALEQFTKIYPKTFTLKSDGKTYNLTEEVLKATRENLSKAYDEGFTKFTVHDPKEDVKPILYSKPTPTKTPSTPTEEIPKVSVDEIPTSPAAGIPEEQPADAPPVETEQVPTWGAWGGEGTPPVGQPVPEPEMPPATASSEEPAWAPTEAEGIGPIPDFEQNKGEDWRASYHRNLAKVAWQRMQEKDVPYRGERIANLNPLEEKARTYIDSMLNVGKTPAGIDAERIYRHIGLRKEGEGWNKAREYIEGSQQPISPQDIAQYEDPHTESVINRMRRKALERFQEDILEPIHNQFIGAGAFGGGRAEQMRQRARQQLLDRLQDQEASLRSQGYQSALQEARHAKDRQLQGGRLAGAIGAEDEARRLQAGQALGQFGEQERMRGLQTAGMARDFGREARDIEQAKLSAAEREFERARLDPQRRLAVLHGIASGHQLPTYIPPEIPIEPSRPTFERSPFSNFGGLAMGLYGQQLQQQQQQQQGGSSLTKPFLHEKTGGRVKLAGGGIADRMMEQYRDQAIQGPQQQQQQMPNQEQALQDTLSGFQQMSRYHDEAAQNSAPMGSFLSRFGFGIAGAPSNMSTAQAMGRAGMEAMPAYEAGLQQQEAHRAKALGFKQAIMNTLKTVEQEKQSMMARKEQMAMKREELDMRRMQIEGSQRLGEENLDFKKQAYLQSQQAAANAPNPVFNKINEKAIENVHHVLSTAPILQKQLHQVEKLADNLYTGTTGGLLSSIGVYGGEGVDQFKATVAELTNTLGTLSGNNAVTQAKLKELHNRLPSMFKSPEGNQAIIRTLKDNLKEMVDQAKFTQNVLSKGGNAVMASNAYEQYAEDKLNNPNQDASPWNYLEGGAAPERREKDNIPKDDRPAADYSIEELRAIIARG